LRFGLKAGAGLAKLDYEPSPPVNNASSDFYQGLWYDYKGAFRPSFLVAGVLEYDLSKDFFLSSGVQACVKTSHVKFEYSNFGYSYTNDFHLRAFYLQVPLNLHYRVGKFFLGAGGYAGLGIGGKWKNEYVLYVSDGVPLKTPEVTESSENIKFGNDFEKSNLKRFDAGLRAEVGFGLKTIRLSIAYEHGLVNNLSSGTVYFDVGSQFYDPKLYHQAITATATYYWLAK